MFRAFVRLGVFSACLFLFACTLNNNTALPPAPNNPAPVVASNTVAAADAGDFIGVGKHWDISSVTAQRVGPPGAVYTEIVVSVSFDQAALGEPPDLTAFASLSTPGHTGMTMPHPSTTLVGLIPIDTDNNPATGFLENDCGAQGTYPGADFVVDLGVFNPILADGNAPIYVDAFTPTNQTGEAMISGGGNVVTVTIPISAIGGSSSGPFNIGTAFGNAASASDCAPNAGYMSDSVGRQPLNLGISTFSAPWTSWRP